MSTIWTHADARVVTKLVAVPVPAPGEVPEAPPVAEALVGSAGEPSAVKPPDVSCGMLLGEEAGEAVDLDGGGD
jgi:hypothetical protein